MPDNIAKSLTGTYRLVSFENRLADGTVQHPFGEHPAGRLTYDGAGRMSVMIMRADRPSFGSGDMRHGTADEVETAFTGFLAYAGGYTVDEQGPAVIHHVAIASFPNWVGGDQVRHVRLDGDVLELTSPPMAFGGSGTVAALVFHREL